jgi:hypothetical protein
MRVLSVSIVVASLVLTVRPLFAAPAEDLPAYCRATNAAVQFQVRCIYTEKGALGRAASMRPNVPPDTWSRCEGNSASWTEMEACLAAAAPRGGAMTSTGGSAGGEARVDDGARPDAAGTAGTGTAAAPASGATAPSAVPSPAAAEAGSPSTVILGPQEGSTASAPEPNRVTRPVPQDEAERHLKGVLERSGETEARCTKKPYNGGWVTVCE